MNRQAALALFAVSLTLLPACVTKIVEPPPSTASVEVRRERFSNETRKAFEDSDDKSALAENLPATEFVRQIQDEWLFALRLCDEFDKGTTRKEFAEAEDFSEPWLNMSDEQKRKDLRGDAAVTFVCPEHWFAWWGRE
jgi:hypothetical protein